MTILVDVRGLEIGTSAGVSLVRGVDFQVLAGKTLAVVGESGSGKTLTSLALMGLLAPELTVRAEAMTFNGVELQGLRPDARRALRGKAMAMVFQEPATALNPVLTVGAQVEEAFLIHPEDDGRWLNKRERVARVRGLFGRVQLEESDEMLGRYPHQLSGGQRQRVCMAMALAHKPKLLIADEPTTALDVTVQAEILKLVKDLQAEMGMAMLWITHDFGVVRQLADDVLVMQHGAMVERGRAKTVLGAPKAAYTRQLLAAMPSLNTKALSAGKVKAKTVLLAEHVGHVYTRPGAWPWSARVEGAAVRGVSFDLREGRTLGVVGESGSGKSTLARILTKLVPAEAGSRVVLMGADLGAAEGEELRVLRKDVQMVFQDPAAALNPKMRVGDAVAEGVRAHKMMPEAEVEPYVRGLLADCGLPDDAYTRWPHQFSGGQKQRICIARALALRPRVIIADEAVSALDVTIQGQILDLFHRLQKEHGTSFVFISHDLRVVSHLAHDVLVMHQGRVVEAGPTQAVFGAPREAYTKRLLGAVI